MSEDDGATEGKARPKPFKPGDGGSVNKPAAEPAATSSAGTAGGGNRTLLGLGAVGVVVALLIAAVVVLWVKVSDRDDSISKQDALNSARSSVLTAARQYAKDFTTYDYKNLDAGFQRTESNLTGTFKQQYTATTQALKETIIKYKATATATVLAIAVQSVTKTDAVVIAFVDQKISNTTSDTPQIERNRMQITLHRKGSGKWLITNLQLP